jgi:hypothetical protein
VYLGLYKQKKAKWQLPFAAFVATPASKRKRHQARHHENILAPATHNRPYVSKLDTQDPPKSVQAACLIF